MFKSEHDYFRLNQINPTLIFSIESKVKKKHIFQGSKIITKNKVKNNLIKNQTRRIRTYSGFIRELNGLSLILF